MNEQPYEHCSICDSLTGKAGAGEDSIFWLDGAIGPLCEDCSHALRDEVLEDEGLTDHAATIRRLEAEAERLNAELATGKYREGTVCGYCSHSGVLLLAEVEALRAVTDDRDAELGHKLSVIAHDGVRKNGQMRHDIGLLLMTAVRKATEAEGMMEVDDAILEARGPHKFCTLQDAAMVLADEVERLQAELDDAATQCGAAEREVKGMYMKTKREAEVAGRRLKKQMDKFTPERIAILRSDLRSGIVDLKEFAATAVVIELEMLDEIEQLQAIVAKLPNMARGAEPKHGWGTRTVINDAWADGFRTAAVEISDAIREAAEAAEAKGGE